jgi:hypothetical protein
MQMPEAHSPGLTGGQHDSRRKSPRVSAKNSKGKSILRLAQDLVAKKCGVIQEDKVLDNMALQQYMDMYKAPLTDSSMQAILKLTEIAEEKQNKKDKGKKEKKQKMKAQDTEVGKGITLKKKYKKKLKMKALGGAVA